MLQRIKVERQIGKHLFTIETGALAKQASGACTVQYGETVTLSAVATGPSRPGMDYFIRYLSQYYELVIFTSLPMQVADPVIKKLDPFHIVMWPLFREATRYEKGEYIKVCF